VLFTFVLISLADIAEEILSNEVEEGDRVLVPTETLRVFHLEVVLLVEDIGLQTLALLRTLAYFLQRLQLQNQPRR
jgi:hypothetical protein